MKQIGYAIDRSALGGCQNDAAYKGRELSVLFSAKSFGMIGGILTAGDLTGIAAIEHPMQVEKGEQLSFCSFLLG